MTADAIVSRELKSLQDELSAAKRKRTHVPPAPPPEPQIAAAAVDDAIDEHQLRDHLHELTKEISGFLEEAENGISAHPKQSVVGALLIGILIGRLFGHR